MTLSATQFLISTQSFSVYLIQSTSRNPVYALIHLHLTKHKSFVWNRRSDDQSRVNRRSTEIYVCDPSHIFLLNYKANCLARYRLYKEGEKKKKK